MFPIPSTLLGYLSGGLGAAALAASAFAGVQTARLHHTQGTVTALQGDLGRAETSLNTVVTVANERAAALKARDATIAQQSASIDGIKAERDADRKTYVAGIVAAETPARANEARAAELAKVPAEAPSDRCEAARSLIEQEMLNVR